MKRGFVIPLAGAAIVLAASLAWLWPRTPRYEFHFEAISDPADIWALVELQRRVDRIEEWQSIHAGCGSALSGLIKAPGNERATSFRQLIRAGDEPQLQMLNGALLALDAQLPATKLAAWRSIEREKLIPLIDAELQAAALRQRRGAIARLLARKESAAMVDRWKMAPFPVNESRRNLQAQDRWLKALRDAVVHDVLPIADWYARIEATQDVHFGSADRTGMFLRRDSGGLGAMALSRRESTADFEVWLRLPAERLGVRPMNAAKADGRKPVGQRQPKEDSKPGTEILLVELDTGIRLFGVRFVEPAGPMADPSRSGAGDGPIAIATGNAADQLAAARQPLTVQWPVSNALINREVFTGLLEQLGLPDTYAVDKLVLAANQETKLPRFEINANVVHREFAGSSTQETLVLDAADPEAAQLKLANLAELARELRDALPNANAFRQMPVQFAKTEDQRQFVCRIEPKDTPAVHLNAAVTDDGRLHWSGLPPVAERAALARRICEQTAALTGLELLVSIDTMQVDGEPARLNGRLSVLGRVVGDQVADDLKDVAWSFSPEGVANVRITPEATQYLDGLRRSASSNPRRVETVSVRQAIESHLGTEYRMLAEQASIVSLENSPFGGLITLGLTIGDWPPLRLGPRRIDSAAEAVPAIDRMLSENEVMAAARQQWGGEARHPRFGMMNSEIVAWSPRAATAEIACRVYFSRGSVQLPLVEDVHYDGQRWVLSTSETICSAYEPKVNELRRQLREFLYTDFGLELDVDVDRNAFGDKQWLRLSPPALVLQASVRIPFIKTEVGVGRIEIDQEGVSWPKRFKIAGMTTIYFPHFAISDPQVTVDLPQQGLMIGAKLTPPMLPLGPIDTDAAPSVQVPLEGYTEEQAKSVKEAFGFADNLPFRLRLDNPWLHLIYLRADIGGQLIDPLLSADGGLRLLDYADLAHAHGTANWNRRRIDVSLESRPLPQVPSFPQMSGEMSLAAREGMRMRGVANVAGYMIHGWFTLASDQRPASMAINGSTKLPLVGQVSVRGRSDVLFRDYEVRAHGSIVMPIPCRAKELHYEFFANTRTRYLRCWWETPDGRVVSYTYELPEADAVDEKVLYAELERVVTDSLSESTSIRPPTDSERLAIEMAPTPPMELKPVPPPIELALPHPTRSEEERPVRVSIQDVEYSVQDGTLHCFSKSQRTDLLQLNVDMAGIEHPLQNSYCLWTHSNGQRYLLVFDNLNRTLRLMNCASLTEIDHVRDLTPTFLPLAAAMYTPAGADEKIRQTTWLTQCAAVQYVDRLLEGWLPDLPAPLAGGYVVKVRSPDADQSPHGGAAFCWAKQYLLQTIYAFEPEVSRDIFDERLARRLTGETREFFTNCLIAVETVEGSAPRLAFVRYEDKDRFQIEIENGDSPLQVTLQSTGEAGIDLFKQANWCSHAAWRKELGLSAAVFVGREGLCAVDEGGWTLLPASRMDAEQWHSPARLTRESFVAWDSDTDRLLPDTLLTPEQRGTADPLDLARQAVTSWQQVRNSHPWQASPLGLMVRLAASRPDEAKKQTEP